jgi:hypothetical protein
MLEEAQMIPAPNIVSQSKFESIFISEKFSLVIHSEQGVIIIIVGAVELEKLILERFLFREFIQGFLP